MSILGAVVRTDRARVDALARRLAELPGVDVAANPGDGRLVVVLEDTADDIAADGTGDSAAARFGRIVTWPEVLWASLAYEYSGPDAPTPHSDAATNFQDWRANPGQSKPAPRTSTMEKA
ncbi:MAG: chaperone NapD [Betaproteobacteria bacterium]|nr:chaperone NapD [Betaproteobacteria bacterium]